jgi:hypothetical protein
MLRLCEQRPQSDDGARWSEIESLVNPTLTAVERRRVSEAFANLRT